LSITDKIFWLRIGFAVLAGIISGALGFLSNNPQAFRGIGIGFLLYFITYIIARVAFGKRMPINEHRKLVTTGMGAYVFMFLTVWILYNTYVYQQAVSVDN
jgi:Rab5-interacting protein (Rab5ip).